MVVMLVDLPFNIIFVENSDIVLLKIHQNLSILNLVLKFPLHTVYSAWSRKRTLAWHSCLLGFKARMEARWERLSPLPPMFSLLATWAVQNSIFMLSLKCKEAWAEKAGREQSQTGGMEGICACTRQLLRDAERAWSWLAKFSLLALEGHVWNSGTRFAEALGFQRCSLNRGCIMYLLKVETASQVQRLKVEHLGLYFLCFSSSSLNEIFLYFTVKSKFIFLGNQILVFWCYCDVISKNDCQDTYNPAFFFLFFNQAFPNRVFIFSTWTSLTLSRFLKNAKYFSKSTELELELVLA